MAQKFGEKEKEQVKSQASTKNTKMNSANKEEESFKEKAEQTYKVNAERKRAFYFSVWSFSRRSLKATAPAEITFWGKEGKSQ